jgi:ankyrin repeat protein
MRGSLHRCWRIGLIAAVLSGGIGAAVAQESIAFVPEEVARALEAGGDVNARLPDGSTPLQWAVYRRDAGKVQQLLRAGADVSLANNYGATAMSIAAEAGDANIIRMLLKAKADPDSPNAEGQTALMAVARTGNVEAATLLVRAGAKVNAREKWGNQSALMWAAAQRQPEMVRFLVRLGA